jgi:hypothetical protein
MARSKMTIKEKFIRRLFQELDRAYTEGSVSLAYVRRIMKRYGLNIKKISKTSMMAKVRAQHKVGRSYSQKKKKNSSEKKVVLIYDQIDAIEATKGNNSLWPQGAFKHKFSKKSKAVVLGLPNGSILIKSLNGKRLWGTFQYDDEVDGIDNEYDQYI